MDITAVSATKIFARSANGSQYLAYSMTYEADTELAMILPIPTPAWSAETAVRFIDLSGYESFFTDMEKGFPRPLSRSKSFSLGIDYLAVHEVGSFVASFVPHQNDFVRLNPQFRIAPEIWAQIPVYDDYGFAVFQLKAGAKKVHPMAFSFPRRSPDELFFPTVHIHHGTVEPEAGFDHLLYCQHTQPIPGWEMSTRDPINKEAVPAHTFMDIEKSKKLVDPDLPVQKLEVIGTFTNKDIVLQTNVAHS